MKEATLYSAFRRLESAQLIRSYWGDENSGARRRYYAITELGRETYHQNRTDWEKAKTIIDGLICVGEATIVPSPSGRGLGRVCTIFQEYACVCNGDEGIVHFVEFVISREHSSELY